MGTVGIGGRSVTNVFLGLIDLCLSSRGKGKSPVWQGVLLQCAVWIKDWSVTIHDVLEQWEEVLFHQGNAKSSLFLEYDSKIFSSAGGGWRASRPIKPMFFSFMIVFKVFLSQFNMFNQYWYNFYFSYIINLLYHIFRFVLNCPFKLR